MRQRKFIVAISGASGAIYGIKLLQALKLVSEIETHIVVSKAAKMTIEHETEFTYDEVLGYADHIHDNSDPSAPIASGSFKCEGMIIAPCSIKIFFNPE